VVVRAVCKVLRRGGGRTLLGRLEEADPSFLDHGPGRGSREETNVVSEGMVPRYVSGYVAGIQRCRFHLRESLLEFPGQQNAGQLALLVPPSGAVAPSVVHGEVFHIFNVDSGTVVLLRTEDGEETTRENRPQLVTQAE
jgi:hypothetical protein